MDISRRGFLKGAAVAGGMLGTASLFGCSGDNQSASASNQDWDKEVDFVVVGAATGQAGAIAGAAAGMSVILLEKRDMVGGALAYSGGNMWLANTEFSQANGDSYEKAKKYLDHMQMGKGADEIVEAYLNNTQKVVELFQETGVNIQPLPRNGEYQPNWEGAQIEGGRSCQVMGENTDGSDVSAAGGMRLNEAFSNACEELGVEVLTKTAGERLVTYRADADAVPEVIGIVAISKGKEIRIKANKGVLLATGGFEWNEEMVLNYLRVPVQGALTWPENTGDGLRMVQTVGADLRLMSETFGMPFFTKHTEYAKEVQQMCCQAGNAARNNAGSIIVDQNGRRFCREDSGYMSMNNTFGGYMNFGEEGFSCDPAWWICDQASYDEHNGPTGTCEAWGYPVPDIPEEDYVFKADTFEELAEEIGLPSEIFAKTVDEYNYYAKDGNDPLFHRGEIGTMGMDPTPLKTLEQPPYYAVAISAGTLGTIGGPKLNGDAQVIHTSGEPVKGLYAMGNCAGVGAPGICYGGEGGTIGPAVTFGVIAANHASQQG